MAEPFVSILAVWRAGVPAIGSLATLVASAGLFRLAQPPMAVEYFLQDSLAPYRPLAIAPGRASIPRRVQPVLRRNTRALIHPAAGGDTGRTGGSAAKV